MVRLIGIMLLLASYQVAYAKRINISDVEYKSIDGNKAEMVIRLDGKYV